MELIGKAQILGADDLPERTVEVPEWGGAVRIRGLTGEERDAFEAEIAGEDETPNLENFRARLLVRTLVDEAGDRLFGDLAVAELGRKSARVLQRLFDVAAELSGIGEDVVEELEGNSPAAPSDASGTP